MPETTESPVIPPPRPPGEFPVMNFEELTAAYANLDGRWRRLVDENAETAVRLEQLELLCCHLVDVTAEQGNQVKPTPIVRTIRAGLGYGAAPYLAPEPSAAAVDEVDRAYAAAADSMGVPPNVAE